jgi:peroxin-11B
MRVGKNIEHFKAAAVAFDSKSAATASDPVLKYLAVGRQLGYGGYLSFDAVTYLDASGIKKLASAKKLQEHAYRAWFGGLMCSAIAGVYSLWRLRERERSLDRKIGEGAAEAKMIERYVNPL